MILKMRTTLWNKTLSNSGVKLGAQIKINNKRMNSMILRRPKHNHPHGMHSDKERMRKSLKMRSLMSLRRHRRKVRDKSFKINKQTA